MTLKTENDSPKKKKSRPFFVLPLLDNFTFRRNMPKNTTLKLFTKTWPPKSDNKIEENSRPLTATLDKPTVLNINLMGIIDMSTMRKEFLNISNLCRLPLSLTLKKRNKTAVIHRPLSLPSPEKNKGRKNKKRPETSENNYKEEENMTQSAKGTKVAKLKKVDEVTKKKSITNDANNNKTFKIPRKRVSTVVKLLEVKGDLGKSTKLPEPCKACGRPDQPERFHSHPVTPLKPAKKEEPPKMKSTVQKPVAMKYKSKQSAEKKSLPPTTQRKPSLPSQKLVHTPPNLDPEPPPNNSTTPTRVKSAKRTLTCYICGREFGTASLPLHEPKCLEKWERENENLPSHLQRKPPIKPDHQVTSEEWNKLAWEASQATLTPCTKCGRTFYPERLLVHQRSCKMVQDNSKLSVDKSVTKPSSPMPPPNIECYICGKMFGAHSIKIHEKQCLKKWHVENDLLPEDIRAPEPVRKVPRSPESSSPRTSLEKEDRPGSGKKSPMFPCYICGRLFTVNSIYIHEPQCLKMWKIENDKLPPHKRRPQPLKPDVKFTQDGKIDYDATNEAKWQSHLNQLVPCQFCSRTFNADRVEVHEKSCKG